MPRGPRGRPTAGTAVLALLLLALPSAAPAQGPLTGLRRGMQSQALYLQGRGYAWEIIVSADGSDGTRELVAEMARNDAALRVIGSVERSGKGYGIRQGVLLARGQIIGFADADNKTPIGEFDKFEPLNR